MNELIRETGQYECAIGLGRTVPPGQLLPDRQPVYVRSWIYVFGAAAIAALVFVIISGLVLVLVLVLVLGGAVWLRAAAPERAVSPLIEVDAAGRGSDAR